MTVITTTRKAKCKDCKFIQPFFRGVSLKRKYYRCSNPESGRCEHKFSTISPSDLVCDKWIITGTPATITNTGLDIPKSGIHKKQGQP